MPELANSVQQPQTIIEIRPHRGGWQCFAGPGVQPYWTGEHQKRTQSASLSATIQNAVASLRWSGSHPERAASCRCLRVRRCGSGGRRSGARQIEFPGISLPVITG